MRKLITLIALTLSISSAQAQTVHEEERAPSADGVEVQQVGDDFYCKERRLGQWFYCERPKVEAPRPTTAAPEAVPAKARLEAITKQLDELKAKAILEPTTENITAYITFQREQLDRASMFADQWRRALWQNPELDYTLQRPVNTLAKRTWVDNRRNDREATMAAIRERYGVFYFFSSGCQACEIFSPIMRGIAERFGLTVMAVSMDGGPSADFPNFLVDTGQYERMGLEGGQVPALVLFDTVTKRPVPIGYGVMAADEIMDRIFVLTRTEPGSDF